MTNIIENTYTALAKTGELYLTEKDYSTNYLGRCKSYYAYLKSTAGFINGAKQSDHRLAVFGRTLIFFFGPS